MNVTSDPIEARAREVRDAFRSTASRDQFLGTFSEKVFDQFWASMRSLGGNSVERATCSPEAWHLYASSEVLEQTREVIDRAGLEPIQAESLMVIAQVTLDAVLGREVNQFDRKWLGLELRENLDLEQLEGSDSKGGVGDE